MASHTAEPQRRQGQLNHCQNTAEMSQSSLLANVTQDVVQMLFCGLSLKIRSHLAHLQISRCLWC